MEMRGFGLGMWGIWVEMQAVRVEIQGIQEIRMEMWGIRVEMQGFKVET